MKRIKRQSINLKAKAIDLQKIKANNAPESQRERHTMEDERCELRPIEGAPHAAGAAAEPIPMHVQDVTFLLTAQKQRRLAAAAAL